MDNKGFTGSTCCHMVIDVHSRQCATGTSTIKFHVFFCVIVSVVGGTRLSARCTCAGIVVVDCNTRKSLDWMDLVHFVKVYPASVSNRFNLLRREKLAPC